MHYRFFLFLFFLVFSTFASANKLDSLRNRLSDIQTENSLQILDEKAILCNNIAVLYQDLDEDEMARTYFLQSIYFTETRINRENNWNDQNTYDMATLYKNIAVFESAQGNAELSKTYMIKAEGYYTALRQLISLEEYNRIMVYFYKMNFTAAYHNADYAYGEECLKKVEQLILGSEGMPRELAETYRYYGELLFAQQVYVRGQEYALKALAIIDQLEDKIEGEELQYINSVIVPRYNTHKDQKVIDFLELREWYGTYDSARYYTQNLAANYVPTYLNDLFILSYAYLNVYRKLNEIEDLTTSYGWQKLGFELAESQTISSQTDKIGGVLGDPRNKVMGLLMTILAVQDEQLSDTSTTYNALRIVDVYNSSRLHLERISYALNAQNWEAQKELKNELDFVNRKMEESIHEESTELNQDSLRSLAYNLSLEIEKAGKETKQELVLDEYRMGQDGFEIRMKTYLEETGKNVLTYFFEAGSDSIYILLANLDTSFVHGSPVHPEIIRDIQELYTLNAHLQMDSLNIERQNQLNHVFFKYLIEPVENYITSSDILIYPTNEFSYISFDALIDDQGNYLTERYAIQYTTSLFSLINPKDKMEFEHIIASFYPSNYGEHNLAHLYNGRHEVDEIHTLFDGSKFSEAEASKKKFLEVAKSNQILHLASHSVLNVERPYESYIIFDATEDAADHKLYAYEIFAATLNSELVILSSCNSAQGQIEEGIGTVSLANAFYFAGVPATVSSLWSAQDKSSSEIMIDFYGALKQGLTKSESLQKAKLAYLEKADKIKRQPFFWANYVLYGNDVPLFERERRYSWVNYAIGLGLTLLLLFIGRRYFKSSSKSSASS